jgi:hypothetical protein
MAQFIIRYQVWPVFTHLTTIDDVGVLDCLLCRGWVLECDKTKAPRPTSASISQYSLRAREQYICQLRYVHQGQVGIEEIRPFTYHFSKFAVLREVLLQHWFSSFIANASQEQLPSPARRCITARGSLYFFSL